MAKDTENSATKILESPDELLNTLSGSESLLNRNKNLILGAIVAVVLVVAGILGYNAYKESQDTEAQKSFFPAVSYFETDSLKKALAGDGASDGLLKVADEYGVTDAGNLANFYAGVAFLKDGKYDDAISHLKDFSSSDLLVQARAYSLLGDAYLEKNQTDEAISYYKKATEYKPNKYFTPGYLMKLATAYEKNKDYKAAIEAYDEVIEKYFDSSEAPNAKKYKSKLEGLADN